MPQDEILLHARFDPKLRHYWFWSTAWWLAMSCAGVMVLPLWILGLGQYICARRLEAQKATLTARTLHLQSGIWFRVEKHVPLDKVQDLSLREGPLLRALGLATLSVETAGQSQQGASDATLTGLLDAAAFRDAVLAQRDRLAAGSSVQAPPELQVLVEIRDILKDLSDRLPPRP